MSEEATAKPAVESGSSTGQPSSLSYATPSTSTGLAADPAVGISRLDAATIALRLAGIYYLIDSGRAIIFLLLGFISDFGEMTRLIAHAIMSPVYVLMFFAIVVGLALFFGAERIARWLLPRQVDDQSPRRTVLGMSAVELQSAAYGIIGVVLIYQAARSLIFVFLGGEPGGNISPPLGGWIELAIGLALFLGGKKIAELWASFRGKYRDEIPAEENDRPAG